ncbi:MAG: D-alanine--D-alanine ligase [Terrimicrobiaceae bacterium]|nr:D-alanine--D-alanine ligase [Terrimicrobiaceae bacterium]
MKRHYEGILENMSVTLVMGGPGKEREVSLRSGAAVAGALRKCGARVNEMDVTGPGFRLPEDTRLVFNMIHGTFGEDGELQALLDGIGMAYTGEGAEGSRMAFDKIETKVCFDRAGVPTSAWKIVHRGESPDWKFPCVLKAPRQGSSVGVHILRSPDEIPAALGDCFQYGERVLVEEFFTGRELTIGILGHQALPVVEIVPNEGFYDYEHKYTKGASEYHVPAQLAPGVTENVQAAALAACRSLALEIYSRVDILLASDGRLNVLEINTIPGMTETSLLPKAASVAGLDFPALCEEIAGLSLARKK